MDGRKRSLWPWIIATVIALPVLYALSIGPVLAVCVRIDTHWPGVIDDAFSVYIFPAQVVYDNGPEPVKSVLDGYVRLFVEFDLRDWFSWSWAG